MCIILKGHTVDNVDVDLNIYYIQNDCLACSPHIFIFNNPFTQTMVFFFKFLGRYVRIKYL